MNNPYSSSLSKNETQIQIIRSTMNDKMRIKILDLIRITNEKGLDNQEILKYLKHNIEQAFPGKWQIVSGLKFTAYLNDDQFPSLLELYAKGSYFMIFSRGLKQHQNPEKLKANQIQPTIMKQEEQIDVKPQIEQHTQSFASFSSNQ